MTIQALNPYLNFDGKAEQAIKLYESALGAKTENVMRFGDVPDMKLPPEHNNRVMHCMLRVGEGVLMLSDSMPGSQQPVVGGNVQVCLHFSDPEDMVKKFDALAAGGKVSLPINDTFWGAKFGMLTDALGIDWMFNCENKR